MSATCPLLAVIDGCPPRMATILLHHLKVLMMWFIMTVYIEGG
jgi:hypothetical protein